MLAPIEAVNATVRLLSAGGDGVSLLVSDSAALPQEYLAALSSGDVRFITVASSEQMPERIGAMSVLNQHEAASAATPAALIVVEPDRFPDLMRRAEVLQRRGKIVVPADPEMVVPGWLRNGAPHDVIWRWAPAEYVARTGLKGHYLEFGTFWGRSFYTAYFYMRGWLGGRFVGFDSFAGLSQPQAQESEFTAGDFQEGAYACNRRSFEMIGNIVGCDQSRLAAVEGFYGDSLVGVDPARYGLEAESVSVCVIDCDLLEPTTQVLDFVEPLLQPGALIYFDDWRLARGSPHVGERAAALAWQRRNPKIDLLEFHRDHWQHQWFIFHRL